MSQEVEGGVNGSESTVSSADPSSEEPSVSENLYGNGGGQKDEPKEESSKSEPEKVESGDEPKGDQEDTASKSTEDKSDDGEKSDGDGEVKAEDYKLSRGEEDFIMQERVDEIEAWAKERGLSKEVAQEIVDRENAFLKVFTDNQETARQELIGKWAKQCEEHETLGGDNFKANQALAQQAVKRFVPDRIRKDMVKSGLADNPDYFEVFVNIGKAMQGDSIVMGDNQPSGQKTSMAERFYGGQQN